MRLAFFCLVMTTFGINELRPSHSMLGVSHEEICSSDQS